MAKAEEPQTQDTDDEDENDESTLLKLFTPGSEFDEVRGVMASCCCTRNNSVAAGIAFC